MYQLLLDSSNKYLSVGLSKDKKVIDSIFYEAWQRQSEVMVLEIENILKRNKADVKDLDSIVVGIGPGSYTGVRIAITIAKTMAYALELKLFKVSSLSLLKDRQNPTICVFNARSGRVYFGVYDNNKVIEPDQVLTIEEAKDYIAKHPDYSLAGDTNVLELDSIDFDIIGNLNDSIKEENLVENVFTLSPIYLKDLMKWSILDLLKTLI